MSLFSKPQTTVASVMESFRKTITNLDKIVQANVLVRADLGEERLKVSAKIEDVDLEIHQAAGISDRLTILVFGPDVTEADING